MKAQEPRKLNKFQAESARGIVDDAARQQDIDKMVRTSTLPKGLLHLANQSFESDQFVSQVWYDSTEKMWKLRRTSKVDGSTSTMAAPTIADLDLAIDVANAVRQRAQEFLLEDNEWQTGDFRLEDGSPDTEMQAVWAWFQTIHGAEYYEIRCDSAWQMMKTEMVRLGYTDTEITVGGLEKAYCNLLDSGKFNHFFAKR